MTAPKGSSRTELNFPGPGRHLLGTRDHDFGASYGRITENIAAGGQGLRGSRPAGAHRSGGSGCPDGLKRLSRKKLSIASYFEVDHLPDNDARSLEQEDWVRHGLGTLPPPQRLAMELVFYLGLSYDEVAAVTDCPVNTVKTRMFHARRKLREKLQTSASAADSQGEEK